MASTEDDDAKKRVQEAVWEWTGRILVLSVVFGAGFFAAWIAYGYGTEGAVHLRELKVKQEAEMLECKNKRVDVEGKLTVTEDRLTKCNSDLSKARTAAAAAAAPPAN